eukprot:5330757-Pyramimonas_sp.AAC.1
MSSPWKAPRTGRGRGAGAETLGRHISGRRAIEAPRGEPPCVRAANGEGCRLEDYFDVDFLDNRRIRFLP